MISHGRQALLGDQGGDEALGKAGMARTSMRTDTLKRIQRLAAVSHTPSRLLAVALLMVSQGLRPLLNLSQTCFLSAILQCLIHNPLLKAYFLSEKHNRHICTNNGTVPLNTFNTGVNGSTSAPPKGLNLGKPFLGSEANGVEAKEREKGCMCCEMDRAFEEVSAPSEGAVHVADVFQFYSDEKTPFGPVTMLYAMWHASAELEGYGQQG